MCEPTTIISVITAGVGLMASVSQRSSEQQQFTEQRVEQQQVVAENNVKQVDNYQRNSIDAHDSARFEMEGISRRSREEDRLATVEKQHASKASLQARAAAQVSAAESGVSGVSIDAMLGDFERSNAEFNFAVDSQRSSAERQDLDDVYAINQKLEGRVHGALPNFQRAPTDKLVQGPAWAPIGQFAGSVAGAYGEWSGNRQPTTTPNSYSKTSNSQSNNRQRG